MLKLPKDLIITGDIFIIPNGLTKSSMMLTSTLMDMETMFYANDCHKTISMDDEKFVQVWYTSPNSPESNWVDHYIDPLAKVYPVKRKGQTYWRISSSLVPVSLLQGHKEGDIVTFNVPVSRFTGIGSREASIIKVSVKLNQSYYRYRNFGKFEEILKRLCQCC